MKQEIEKQVLIHFKENRETIVKISTGLGKAKIIEDIILRGEAERQGEVRILILTDRYIMQQQYADMMKEIFSKDRSYKNISFQIRKYDEIEEEYRLKGFDIIILDNANHITREEYDRICRINEQSKKITFYTVPSKWLDEIKDFEYIFQRTESQIENLCIKILGKFKLNPIEGEFLKAKNGIILRPDFYAKKDEKNVVVEIKNYRDRYISNQALNSIIGRIIKYRTATNLEKDTKICFFLMCEVEDKIKNEIYEKYNTIILDIRNIKYICLQDARLLVELENSIPYPINDIKEQELTDKIFQQVENINYKEYEKSETERLIEKLLNVKPGKQDKTYKEYEEVCTEIIKYLFESEFTQIKEQSETKDDLFVMDLLCGLKGSNTFWKILIEHYNSRFIVFEYKNYKEEINQNNIFITGKYLFDSALRNVAILISRIRI